VKREKLEEIRKRLSSEENPFSMNPDYDLAMLWNKIHEVEILVVENTSDIKWIKKFLVPEVIFSIGSFLTFIGILLSLIG